MFEKNNAVSRAVANDWITGILENNLRSTKLADKVLEMTKTFGKDSPRRVLAYKVAAMCGDVSIKDLHSILFQSKLFHAELRTQGVHPSAPSQKGATGSRLGRHSGPETRGVGAGKQHGKIRP